MIDRIFTAALTFCLLIGATVAVAGAWFDSRSLEQVVHLPAVNVVAKRAMPRVDVAAAEAQSTRVQ
jgi:hypothetical protein